MPDAKVGNPRAGGKPTTKKGSPFGIPMWGWMIGIALGLIVGYMVVKKSSNSGTSSSGSDSSPLGNSDTGGGGGAVAGSPSPLSPVLIAQGISNNGSSDPGSVTPSGDSSTSTSPVSPYSTPTTPFALVGSTYYQPSAPGSDFMIPLPPSHPGTPGASQLPDALTGTNTVRPGFQP